MESAAAAAAAASAALTAAEAVAGPAADSAAAAAAAAAAVAAEAAADWRLAQDRLQIRRGCDAASLSPDGCRPLHSSSRFQPLLRQLRTPQACRTH